MSSTLNPVGSGARATGMGGAFIGVADDATAASWNPAGLVQLEKPEVSLVGSYFNRSQRYSSDVHPEIAADNSMDAGGVNFASAVYPFTLFKRNMVLSVNYQRLYEMGKDISFKYTWDMDGDTIDDAITFTQKGCLYALSPALAAQITPAFHLGATLNLWRNDLGDNGWENTYRSHGTGTMSGYAYENRVDRHTEVSFRGLNANVGLLWNFLGPFTAGLVYKTSFDARLEKRSKTFLSQDIPELGYHDEVTRVRDEDMTMQMPASYGLGLSYRHSDTWTVAFDLYRTQWSRFLIRKSDGKEVNPLDSRPISEGRLKDTTQVRLGTEYLFIRGQHVIPLRAGIFCDPEPTTGSLDDYYGFSLGTGYSNGRLSLDASYQYRFGNDVSGDIPAIEGSSADVAQHTLMMSLILYLR